MMQAQKIRIYCGNLFFPIKMAHFANKFVCSDQTGTCLLIKQDKRFELYVIFQKKNRTQVLKWRMLQMVLVSDKFDELSKMIWVNNLSDPIIQALHTESDEIL